MWALCGCGGGPAALEPPALLPIDPVPLVEVSDWVPEMAQAGPERHGFIEQVHDHCCVILDVCRGFARHASFRTRPDGPATSRNAFRAGDYVGYRLNPERRIEAVWFEPISGDLR